MWFTRRDRRERDLDDEIAAHLRMAVEDRVAEGDEAGAARRAAHRQFGNVGLVKEVTRDVWGWSGFGSEFRSAWRNVKARRIRVVLAVALLGLAIGTNTAIFSVADSLVFRRVTYLEPDTLVHIQSRNTRIGGSPSRFLTAPRLEAWRAQADLFSYVHGSTTGNVFLIEEGRTEELLIVGVTPGLFEMLGSVPRWGRPLTPDDAVQQTPHAVLISEQMARQRFGEPAAAIGRTLQTVAEPLLVVGVMQADFRFPSVREQVWRAIDLRRERARPASIARVKPGRSFDQLAALVEERSVLIARETGEEGTYQASIVPLEAQNLVDDQRRMLLVLFGAAMCLLLTACANVVALELASAVSRTRMYAVHLAVGASRSNLARISLIEAAITVGSAGILAAAVGFAVTRALAASFPASLLSRSVNPIDFDGRTAVFMAVVVAATWLLSTMPLLRYLLKVNLLEVLRLEASGSIGSRTSSRLRQALTSVEIGVAVTLLIGGLLYVRTYRSYVNLDKGFNSNGLAVVNYTLPPQMYTSASAYRLLSGDALVRSLRARPGVLGVSSGTSPYLMGGVWAPSPVAVDGRNADVNRLSLGYFAVDPDYFSVVGIPLRAGRFFEPGESQTNVIVGEALARRLWPDGDAVGHTFLWDRQTFSVVGVVGHVLTDRNEPGVEVPHVFQFYVAKQPPPPATPDRPLGAAVASIGTSVVVRIDSRRRAADVLRTAQDLDQRAIVNLEFLDDVYARRFGDRLLATRIVGGFGVFAFIVSAAGLYAVMAFLVATRRREIGLRMALGAAPSDVLKWVMGSSARLVIPGVVLGLIGAFVGARWIESQLFGVSPLDPSTYIIVATVVLAGAMLATWYPARQAATVDPIVALRD